MAADGTSPPTGPGPQPVDDPPPALVSRVAEDFIEPADIAAYPHFPQGAAPSDDDLVFVAEVRALRLRAAARSEWAQTHGHDPMAVFGAGLRPRLADPAAFVSAVRAALGSVDCAIRRR